MCIISFHLQEHPIYKMVLIANRDERYNRPTDQAHFWQDAPAILAGRDLEAMGTWMGITKQGRFAALTNYRNPLKEKKAPASRGNLVSSYLKGNESAEAFLEQLRHDRDNYNGFNLVAGTVDELFFYNKVEDQILPLSPGTYSVSNASLNTPWPKVKKARTLLSDYVRDNETIDLNELFNQLYDDAEANNHQLPNTGVSLDVEKKLSPIFIQTEGYGTRSSTVLLVTHHNQVTFLERTFKEGKSNGSVVHKQFHIQ